jgi:YD repeat-containing protein
MTDANGVVTAYTYDLRQRLKSVAVGGQLTQYDYDLAGQLKKVTQPDASTLGYDHDDAHRLTAVYDNLGNRIDYVLDNAGNRKEEKVTGAGGVLKRKLTRVIDALGRVQQTTSGE